MSLVRHFSRKFLINSVKSETILNRSKNCLICARFLNYSPKEYGDNPSPAPIFIKNEVQTLLKTLSRVDLGRVYRKRKLGEKLHQPTIKFMTDQQLEEAMNEIKRKVDDLLQMPPIVPARKPIDRTLSKDPALQGLDTAKFVFTDITFGLRNSDRLIVIRNPDGNLNEADWDTRDRINQIYFPVQGRSISVPKMFEDQYFEDLLTRKEYEYVLDRACLQFEPNDPKYQKVISITYQHINDNNQFESLRSTRHFGGLVFFLAWHKIVDNLLLELIENCRIDEASCLVQLYGQIHNVKFDGNQLEVVEEFIRKFADKRGALELSIQAYKELERQRRELEAGIKTAHGLN